MAKSGALRSGWEGHGVVAKLFFGDELGPIEMNGGGGKSRIPFLCEFCAALRPPPHHGKTGRAGDPGRQTINTRASGEGSDRLLMKWHGKICAQAGFKLLIDAATQFADIGKEAADLNFQQTLLKNVKDSAL